MTKIKIIKRDDPRASGPPASNVPPKKPRKQRSIEGTIQGWITERRENDDAEHRSRASALAVWNTDQIPAEAV